MKNSPKLAVVLIYVRIRKYIIIYLIFLRANLVRNLRCKFRRRWFYISLILLQTLHQRVLTTKEVKRKYKGFLKMGSPKHRYKTKYWKFDKNQSYHWVQRVNAEKIELNSIWVLILTIFIVSYCGQMLLFVEGVALVKAIRYECLKLSENQSKAIGNVYLNLSENDYYRALIEMPSKYDHDLIDRPFLKTPVFYCQVDSVTNETKRVPFRNVTYENLLYLKYRGYDA